MIRRPHGVGLRLSIMRSEVGDLELKTRNESVERRGLGWGDCKKMQSPPLARWMPRFVCEVKRMDSDYGGGCL